MGSAVPSLSYLPRHEQRSEVALRQKPIVHAAHQLEVVFTGWTVPRVWLLMMKFQHSPLCTALASLVYEGAAPTVTLDHTAFDLVGT